MDTGLRQYDEQEDRLANMSYNGPHWAVIPALNFAGWQKNRDPLLVYKL